MPFYPLPLPGYDRKPESRTRLAINEDSPYRRDLAFDWVAGDTELMDATGVATISRNTSAPTKAPTREGLISRFANGVLDALLLGEHTWIDPNKPFSLAFRILWNSEEFNQPFLFKTTGSEPLQFIFSTNASYSNCWLGSFDNTTWARAKSGTSFAPAGQWNSVVITFDGVNASNLSSFRFYGNGAVKTPITGGATVSMPNENRLGRTDGAGREFNGDWAGARIWENRCLPAPLALELSRRYWAPFGQPISYRVGYPRFYFVPAAGQGALIRSISEVLQATETNLRALKQNRVEATNLNVPEAAVGPRGLTRLLLETTSLFEGLMGSRAMSRQRGETLQQSEAAQSVKGLTRLVVDSLQLAEARDRVLGFVRSVSETLQIAEASQSVLGFVRSVLETLDLSEGRLWSLGLVRAVTEFLQASVANARTRLMARSVAAAVQANESLLPVRLLVRNRNTALQAIEAAFSGQVLLRLRGETAELQEASAIARGFAQVSGETLSLMELALSSTVKGVVAVLCGSVSILAAVAGALFQSSASTGGVSIKASSGGQPDAPDCDEKPES